MSNNPARDAALKRWHNKPMGGSSKAGFNKLGSSDGGKARAQELSASERSTIAAKGGKAKSEKSK